MKPEELLYFLVSYVASLDEMVSNTSGDVAEILAARRDAFARQVREAVSVHTYRRTPTGWARTETT